MAGKSCPREQRVAVAQMHGIMTWRSQQLQLYVCCSCNVDLFNFLSTPFDCPKARSTALASVLSTSLYNVIFTLSSLQVITIDLQHIRCTSSCEQHADGCTHDVSAKDSLHCTSMSWRTSCLDAALFKEGCAEEAFYWILLCPAFTPEILHIKHGCCTGG